MKLEEKGKIILPPVLSKYPELVSKEVQLWSNIISATHWEIWDRNEPNGADFYVGIMELGHIHLDGSVHIPSTKKISETLVNKGLAQKFPYAENWVQYLITDKKTAVHAAWLFKLHYNYLNNNATDTLKAMKEYKMLA